ncbi:MAG: hypothetical protein V4537_12385 [Pseudomonadota bacterium]
MLRAGLTLAALLASTAAVAQDNAATAVPPPPVIERYSLPPGNSQTPAPTPVPTATPVPAPTPTPRPTATRTPAAALPTSTPTPSTVRAPAPTPTASATPAAVPTTDAQPSPEASAAVPLPDATPTGLASEPAVTPLPQTPRDGWRWLWWTIGMLVVGAGGFALWRRGQGNPSDPVAHVVEPAERDAVPAAAAPTPSPPAAPVAPVAPQPKRTLSLDFRAQRLWTRGPDAFLAFEMIVTNAAAAAIDAIRPVVTLASAGPETAAEIAEFTARASQLPGGDPFTLQPGETRSVAGELMLPGDAMYVTTAADRELIVPLALVSLQWRAGLSIGTTSDAFVIGTGDPSSPRLGPIWVDRSGQEYLRLDARRFTPR